MAKNETYLITDLSKSTALLSERGWKHLKEKREEVHFLYQLFLKLIEEMELQKTTSEAVSRSPSNLDRNSYDYKRISFPNTASPCGLRFSINIVGSVRNL